MDTDTHPPFTRDRVTWLAYLLLVYMAYSPAIFGPIMPFLRADLRLSYAVGGMHLSAQAFGMAAAGSLADRLAGRWGCRRVLWAGAVGIAAGCTLLALSQTPVLSISCAFLMGFAGALTQVMVQAILADRHGSRMALALTEANIGASLSSFLAPLLVGIFQQVGIGWRGALFVTLASLLPLAAVFGRQPVADSVKKTGPAAASGGRLPRKYWVIWSLVLFFIGIEWCLLSWSAEFLVSAAGLEKAAAATLVSTLAFAIIVGRTTGSLLARRFQTPVILLGALFFCLAGFPLFWLGGSLGLRIAGLFVAGLGTANLFPLAMTIALGTAPGQANLASARLSLAIGLAGFTAPLGLGWLADRIGLQSALGLVGVFIISALLIHLFTFRSYSIE
jgi:MFS family permease